MYETTTLPNALTSCCAFFRLRGEHSCAAPDDGRQEALGDRAPRLSSTVTRSTDARAFLGHSKRSLWACEAVAVKLLPCFIASAFTTEQTANWGSAWRTQDGAFLQGWRIIQSREQEATVDRCCLAPWGAIYKTSGKAVSASGPPPFDASGGPIPPATYPTVKLVLSRNGGDQKQAKVAQPACSPKPPHAPAKERKAAHNATANEQAPQSTKQSGAASDAKPAARKNGASSKKRQPILDLFD